MRYNYSQSDKSNLDWFEKDTSKRTLIRMKIERGVFGFKNKIVQAKEGRGSFRGLNDIEIHFKYPITVISGKNGTGKSTLLACAACAFHNLKYTGFRPYLRRQTYYTMSDFFVRSIGESSPTGSCVAYQILHDSWRKSKITPTGVGLNWQYRIKSYWGGKWNRNSSRIYRDVVYLGIERIVPHSEKSISKSYRSKFRKTGEEGYEKNVKETVGRIIGKPYEEFFYLKHSKYRLPSSSHVVKLIQV